MIVQQLANGVFLGAVYALFALGYTLVFGVLDILNLAHGAVFAVAAYLTWTLVAAGMPLPLAALVGILAGGVLGVILDRIAFAPLRKRNAGTLVPLISSIGFAIVVTGLMRGGYGIDERHFAESALPNAPLHLGPVTCTPLELTIFATAIVLMLALSWVMRATPLGRRIRAVAEDRTAAALLGIDLERTIAATFFLASALGGAAGILTALQYNSLTLEMGGRVELKGLAVIILGGMGSIPGAVIGGFALGIVETIAIAAGFSPWRDAIAFGVMFLVLVIRPTGIFGKRALRAA